MVKRAKKRQRDPVSLSPDAIPVDIDRDTILDDRQADTVQSMIERCIVSVHDADDRMIVRDRLGDIPCVNYVAKVVRTNPDVQVSDGRTLNMVLHDELYRSCSPPDQDTSITCLQKVIDVPEYAADVLRTSAFSLTDRACDLRSQTVSCFEFLLNKVSEMTDLAVTLSNDDLLDDFSSVAFGVHVVGDDHVKYNAHLFDTFYPRIYVDTDAIAEKNYSSSDRHFGFDHDITDGLPVASNMIPAPCDITDDDEDIFEIRVGDDVIQLSDEGYDQKTHRIVGRQSEFSMGDRLAIPLYLHLMFNRSPFGREELPNHPDMSFTLVNGLHCRSPTGGMTHCIDYLVGDHAKLLRRYAPDGLAEAFDFSQTCFTNDRAQSCLEKYIDHGATEVGSDAVLAILPHLAQPLCHDERGSVPCIAYITRKAERDLNGYVDQLTHWYAMSDDVLLNKLETIEGANAFAQAIDNVENALTHLVPRFPVDDDGIKLDTLLEGCAMDDGTPVSCLDVLFDTVHRHFRSDTPLTHYHHWSFFNVLKRVLRNVDLSRHTCSVNGKRVTCVERYFDMLDTLRSNRELYGEHFTRRAKRFRPLIAAAIGVPIVKARRQRSITRLSMPTGTTWKSPRGRLIEAYNFSILYPLKNWDETDESFNDLHAVCSIPLHRPYCRDASGRLRSCIDHIVENYTDSEGTLNQYGVSLLLNNTYFEQFPESIQRLVFDNLNATIASGEEIKAGVNEFAGSTVMINMGKIQCPTSSSLESRKCHDRTCLAYLTALPYASLRLSEKDLDIDVTENELTKISRMRNVVDRIGDDDFYVHGEDPYNLCGVWDLVVDSSPVADYNKRLRAFVESFNAMMQNVSIPYRGGQARLRVTVSTDDDAPDMQCRTVYTDASGNESIGQSQRIGKLMSVVQKHQPNMANELNALLTQKPSRRAQTYTMVISRRLADFLRASSCQHWMSCVNLYSGSNMNVLLDYYEKGFYIAYVADDEWSPTWYARAILVPVINNQTGAFEGFGLPQTTYGLNAVARAMRESLEILLQKRGLLFTQPVDERMIYDVASVGPGVQYTTPVAVSWHSIADEFAAELNKQKSKSKKPLSECDVWKKQNEFFEQYVTLDGRQANDRLWVDPIQVPPVSDVTLPEGRVYE